MCVRVRARAHACVAVYSASGCSCVRLRTEQDGVDVSICVWLMRHIFIITYNGRGVRFHRGTLQQQHRCVLSFFGKGVR